ncbi:MAG: alpha-ketoglutarate-dependent dioxygenase AlkB [Armatimonadetes bacterium]|nr:alpha-ketoglutarate-dependent dioxygenase AlkB [Armatimonadota bacterium]
MPPGVCVVRDYVSIDDEASLLRSVDASPWSNDLARRVQHYGYRYDYRKRSVDPSMRLGPLPVWLKELGNRLVADGWFNVPPDQAIVNEYLPGQGIAAHVDCEPCFGPIIASLSLGAPCTMVFRPVGGGSVIDVDLPARSLTVLSGSGRYKWTHGIPARKADRVGGVRRPRGRRVSMTFRTVVI